MNKKNKILIHVLLILSLPILVLILSNDKVYARAEAGNVVAKKAVLQGVNYCYTQGAINDTAPSLLGFNSFTELIKNSRPYSNGDFVALPSGLTLVNDNDVDCNSLFAGYGGGSGNNRFQGAFSLFGKKYQGFSSADDNSEKKIFLEGMGYTKQDTSGSCIAFEYTNEFFASGSGRMVSAKAYTDNICLKEGAFAKQDYGPNANNAIKSRVPITFELSSDKKTITKLKTDHGSVGDGSKKDMGRVEVSVNINASDTSPSASCSGDPAWICELRQEVSANFSYLLKTRDQLGGFYSYVHSYVNGEGESYYKIPENRNGNKFGIAANKAINYMSDGAYDNSGSLRFSDAEKLSYYIQVVREWFYDGEEDKDSYWLCDTNGIDWNDYYNFNKEVKRTPSGELGSCRIALGEAKSGVGDANGFSGDYFDASGGTKLGLSAVIDEINRLSDLVGGEQIPDVSPGTTDSTKIDCLTSGAAKNLGWIICPILSFASEVSGSMYTNFVEPALKVDPRLFDDHGSDYDVYGAWSTFQGFANVIFIIFFLFVIFSQVTGVGIDNYGIKKIMPKLIITAILINLSYFICLIFVDLSNILGNGITGLFSELSKNLGMSTSIANNDGGSIVVSIGSTMLTGVTLFGAGYLAFVTAPMWILPLIVAAIGLLISVIFLFILLSVREAAIVIFTVISPLAFICYMLPNTKPLFDRYVKISKVLLLLYPICGLMVAGGGYVSKLLLSVGIADQGLFSTFAAMIISIVPVFFIPKVVKSSLSALGSIGATLSSFGDRMRGRATSGIRNSGAYKGSQERLREFQTRRRAGIDNNGRPLDFNNMTLRQRLARGVLTRRGFARNRAQYNRDQSTRDAEGLLLDDNYMANMAAHRDAALSNEREKMYGEVYDRETDKRIVEAELTSALSGEDAERASAALNALIKKGGISEAFTALRAAPWNSMSANVRNRLIQTMGNSGIDAMSAFSKYRNSGGTGTFDEWANGTASDKSTAKYGSYANYLNEKGANAADNYGKDEMQFLKGLQSSLAGAGGMGASSFGRMLGNAGINSKDAQVRKEAYDMIRSQIGNGTITAGDLGLSSSKVASMNNEMSEALRNGYSDYIASKNPSLSRSQAEAHADAAIKSAFKQQIQDIKADNTGRLLSGMESGTRNLLGL